MTEPAFERLIFIGRFQPFHHGHMAVLQAALARAQRVSVVLGSANQARSVRNVWNEAEREQMIRAAVDEDQARRLEFAAVPDILYAEEVWERLVRAAIVQHPPAARTGLIGHSKDPTSYYLEVFPEWPYVALPNHRGLHATAIRERLLAAGPAGAGAVLDGELVEHVPAGVRAWLHEFVRGAGFAQVCEEFRVVQEFRQDWADAPYPPLFVTADALIQHDDHILLIRRGRAPGAGLLALPGGFLDVGERIEAACRRELQEETGLDLAQQPHELVLHKVFDDPQRAARGRMITHGFHYRLDPAQPRPAVRGGDDAALAQWLAIDSLSGAEFFEDHYMIIQNLLDLY